MTIYEKWRVTLILIGIIVVVLMSGCEYKPPMHSQDVQELVKLCKGKAKLKMRNNYVYDVWCIK